METARSSSLTTESDNSPLCARKSLDFVFQLVTIRLGVVLCKTVYDTTPKLNMNEIQAKSNIKLLGKHKGSIAASSHSGL